MVETIRPTARYVLNALWSGRSRSLISFASLCALAAFLVWRWATPAVAITNDRVLAAGQWADERRCAECHAEAVQFWQTGHARTLHRATDPHSLARLERWTQARPAGAPLSIHVDEADDGTVDGVSAVLADSTSAQGLPLDWCFGSGRHACTWVSVLPDSWGYDDLLEFRWTWYHELEAFGVTPGQPTQPSVGFHRDLGLLFDHAKARACFACHTSQLPADGTQLDGPELRSGVTCQRCHGPQQQHALSQGQVVTGSLRGLSQMESIRRCAQCHRSADERAPPEIHPDNAEIVRFQPVGLVQSPCFRNSQNMTCVTCHDPHRRMDEQDSGGIWQCVQCHDPARSEHTLCGLGRRDDCLMCHMPKVRGSAPVSFTDHWIRVRDRAGERP